MFKHFPPLMRTMQTMLFCSLAVSAIFAQNNTLPFTPSQIGFPYIQNYAQADFKGDDNFTRSQTWSIIRDQRGVYYFGYQVGILTYDGNTWQKIKVSNNTVRSLAMGADGTIYVGGVNTFGYLTARDNGEMGYVSLSDKVAAADSSFKDVWTVVATDKGIYFQTYYRLFRWDGNLMKVWQPQTSFHVAFQVNNELYLKHTRVGLMQMIDDSLQFAAGGTTFKDKRIIAVLPHSPEKILIATREAGLYTYHKNKGLEKLSNEIDDYLQENHAYHGNRLSDGNYVFATLNDGVVVTNPEGRKLYLLNKSGGLPDNLINYTYPDKQGGFWLALDKGISHVESPLKISRYGENSGFQGSVLSLAEYKGHLYLGTSQGFYRSTLAAGKNRMRFERMPKLPSLGYDQLSTANGLLIASSVNGIHLIRNNSHEKIFSGIAYSLQQSSHNKELVYAGLSNGLISLTPGNNRGWNFQKRYKEIKETILSIAEEKNGDLWLGSKVRGVIRIHAPLLSNYTSTDDTNALVDRYNDSHGLPKGEEIYVFNIDGKLIFTSTKGTFYFDHTRQQFFPDSTFGLDFASRERSAFQIVEDSNNNIWMMTQKYETILARKQNNNSYQLEEIPFRRIPFTKINAIYPKADGITWFGGFNGLIRYDTNVQRNYENDFSTLINTVKIGSDSSVISGNHWSPAERDFEFPYALNALSFQFAAPFFENESANKFQHYLEGFAENWSGWSSENKANFTNLSEGDYRFRVRAKNVYGHLGEEAVFAFSILPPWYRSWWAYLLYGILAFTAIGSVFKYRIRYLEEKAKELEGIIVERTAQIREQKDQLAEQAEQLKELDKLKSRFFANISHEFRTPLTLILGPIDNLRQRFTGKDDQHELGMMQRNGRRLLNLINQLLDLSRLEDGKMILEARPDDFLAFLRGQVFSFESLARQKRIALEYHSDKAENDALEMYFDPDKLDKVFVNILSNAFKFTPADGKISVAVDLSSAKTAPGEEGGTVIVRISDTGPGIEAERLSLIFERFYTVDQSFTKKQRGTGIGLALAKEFLDLHHGEITAESTVGEGTTFIVSLPLGKAHLNDEEIVDYMSPDEMVAVDISEIAPDVVEGEPIETSSPTADKDAPTLLIVEDNADMRNYIHNHLSDLYQISEAEDGREGLEKALAMMPDLIISDVMMPRMDGYQLCDALKKDARTSHVPVILLTAKSSSDSKIEGLELGADDYLVKPFVAKELLARVKNLIEQRQLLRQRFSKEIIKVAPSEITVTPVDERFLKKAIEIVEERMADEEFSVELLSREIGMSRMQLHRKLKALTDQSPSMFIRTLRLKRAAQLLQQHSGNISEVAYDVGFNNLSYFAKAFREQFGMLPKEYEKKMGK